MREILRDFKENSNVAKLFGDLSKPFNTATQIFRVNALYSSGIWKTIAEFAVESGLKGDTGSFAQFYAYIALNFLGARRCHVQHKRSMSVLLP
jgi:hypothetical protein